MNSIKVVVEANIPSVLIIENEYYNSSLLPFQTSKIRKKKAKDKIIHGGFEANAPPILVKTLSLLGA